MKPKEILELCKLEARRAKTAAADAARAEAQVAAVERTLAAYQRQIEDEVGQAATRGTWDPVALWYPAAEDRLRSLQSELERRAGEAASARATLRSARLEEERFDALRTEVQAHRRKQTARREQKQLDETTRLRRRSNGRTEP